MLHGIMGDNITNTLNPETEAQKLLEEYWPEGEFPINPADIANKMGIRVLITTFDDSKISGAVMKEEDGQPEILVNKKDPPTRIRFSIAHELGHIIHNEQNKQFVYLDYRNQLASNGTDPHELFANQFAACLLMPKKDVGAAFNFLKLSELAQYFGVSEQAIKFRLLNLNIMN